MKPKLFFSTIALVLTLLLVFPVSVIHAQAVDPSDASSTPGTDNTDDTQGNQDDASSTDDLPILTISTTTDDTSSTTAETTFSLTDTESNTNEDASNTDPNTDGSSTPVTPSPITIHLDVEGTNSSMYDSDITVTACASPNNSSTEVTAYCALQQSNLPTVWSNYAGYGEGLVSVNGEGDWNNGPWWTLFSDGQPLSDSADNHQLSAGETFLVTDNRMPVEISVSTTSPTVGSTTTVTVEGFSSFNFDYEPLAGATIVGADASTTDANGQTTITATSSDPFTISATEDGYLQSDSVTIAPQAPAIVSIPITLDVETATTTLFDGTLNVSGCDDGHGDSTTVPNGYCALQESGIATTWSWYDFGGEDAFLDTASGVGNGSGSNNYWTWFSNGTEGETGLNQHALTAGETLTVAIDRMPLQIDVSSTSPSVGAATTVTVEGFSSTDFDYEPVAGATIVGTNATTVVNGQAVVIATSSDPFTISATADGYISSAAVTITPVGNPSGSNNSGNSGDSGSESNTGTANISSAFTYLVSQQNADGSFSDSPEYTPWAALALALPDAPLSARSQVANYLKTATPTLSTVTDYERYAIALMALGINPYSGTNTDYVTPIVTAFDGTQIGSASEDNDDIFGLIVLDKAGFTSSDTLIQKDVAFIVSKQNVNGSWDSSPDLTGAALQALTPLTSLSGISTSITKAESYLHSVQGADGSFGNIAATSWAWDGLSAVGQSSTNWSVSGNTPITALANAQQIDGSITDTSNDNSLLRVWNTSYALTALEGRSWQSLMQSFSKETVGIGGSSTFTASTTAATSTSPTNTSTIATTTSAVATSTVGTPEIDDGVWTENVTPAHSYLPGTASADVSISTTSTSVVSNASATTNDLTAAVANSTASTSLWNAIVGFFAWLGHLFGKIF